MQVAVWDTYVKRPDGSVHHFDIIVQESVKTAARIFEFGKKYLASKGLADCQLDTDECQFCHIEKPNEAMVEAIRDQGYYILELDDIPATLPPEPSRREMVLYLKAHYPEHRFADFRDKGEAKVRAMLQG